MILNVLLLSLVTTFQPARPTIGDAITIDFGTATTVDPSPDYEVMSTQGNRVTIRTFVPHPIAVNGRSADGPVSIVVPIHSVLKQDDRLVPAPLKPPKDEPWPRLPLLAIGAAAALALALWTIVAIMARRRVPKPEIVLAPREVFRGSLARARRWADLADAVRAYLASVRPDLGAELTTSELLARIGTPPSSVILSDSEGSQNARRAPQAALAEILRQGDLEKFSPWGPRPSNFDAALAAAREIPAWAEPPAPASEEAAA